MNDSVVIGMGATVMVLIAAVVVLMVGRAAASGDISRNGSVGIRTRWTQASDAAWLAGHKAGSRQVRMAGWGSILLAVLGFLSGFLALTGISSDLTNSIVVAFILASCVWMIAWCLVAAQQANTAAKAVLGESGSS